MVRVRRTVGMADRNPFYRSEIRLQYSLTEDEPQATHMLFNTLLGPSDCPRLQFNVLSIDYVRITNCFMIMIMR